MTTTTDEPLLSPLPDLPARRLRGTTVPDALPDALRELLTAERDATEAAIQARADFARLSSATTAEAAAREDHQATMQRQEKGDFGPPSTTASDKWIADVEAAHRRALYLTEKARDAAGEATRWLSSKTNTTALAEHLDEQRARHVQRVTAALVKMQADVTAITVLDALTAATDRTTITGGRGSRLVMFPDPTHPSGPVLDAARTLARLLGTP